MLLFYVQKFYSHGKIFLGALLNNFNVEADTSLNTFIREHANLKGTKYMCREGGCGSCIVTVQSSHPVSKKEQCFAVNSCLIPILACHGKAITTIEGIGSRRKGYHKIQSFLAKFNGTQCGYCSPGMVMNMYGLIKDNPKITMREVENSFGGNICRCTGYRPILDAFKALACDASNDLKQKCKDIEDLMNECQLNGKSCTKKCLSCKNDPTNKDATTEETENYETDFAELALAPKKLKLRVSGTALWYRVTTVYEIFQIFDLITPNLYMLVNGNTAQGVYRIVHPPGVFIDINEVAELKTFAVYGDHLVLGANMTLAETIKFFRKISTQNPLLYGYTGVLADHIELVANVPVRNVGTLAGNLSIKHQHNEFPSDIFLILLTVGAHVQIRDLTGIVDTISLLQYLDTNMYNKVMIKIILPALSSNHYHLKTYKIMPRYQNVHALVNAGFLFRINRQNYLVEERPVIVYGHINDKFTHAYETESYLSGKSLMNQQVLNWALKTLSAELLPQNYSAEASPKYRKQLALSLFYRYVLSVNPDIVNKRFRSGYNNLQRPISSGKQEYVTNKKNWPVSKPVQKLEALIQCAGEAEYVNDKPSLPGELYGALVLANKSNAVILNIDATAALNFPGVVAFYSADDIPGVNSYIQPNPFFPELEEVFCSNKTLYAGQPVGIVVATTQELAIKASTCVKVSYSSVEKPHMTVEEVLASGDKSRIILQEAIVPTGTKSDIKHVIKGTYTLEGQYHYTLELQSCLCVPTDVGMTVYSSTQWTSGVQNAISLALNIPSNTINVEVKRLGGAYGCKISRSSMVATACAIAAYKLHQPVRMVLNLETNMRAIGKRYPLLAKYEVAVNDNGEIQHLILDMYENYGYALNDTVGIFARDGVKNFYDFSTWKVNIYAVKTDLASSSWTRAPGTTEGIATIENIMDHIAFVTKKDPIEIRKLNCNPKEKAVLDEMIQTILTSSNYTNRLQQVENYNKENRWKKKGISFVPMLFNIVFFPNYHSTVSIFAGDGTVGVTCGGIEMGQGLNTKVAQVAAYGLGIELDKVKIFPSMNITSPNNFPTGGSIGSDTTSYATLRCCEEIMRRLTPIKVKMGNPTWLALVQAASLAGINLSAQYMYSIGEPVLRNYPVYGAVVLETEVDILTGQYQVLRADILEDAGESLSPYVDIGQIEGAFIMGLGYFHSEELIYNKEDGALLTDRTWTYWPPGAGDIPIDFRITFRKNSPNPNGVLSSKTTGEPAFCISVSLQQALRMAIESARKDSGEAPEWLNLYQPCTFEKVLLAAKTNPKDFSLF
ncbi:uncharacterized protein isoform X2 [Rhodnius prolixus]|uniref:uncharacterized protein isoform X2 n=1 Tax=Rhodnius prolixus TaxID=13249 RepID=UPI003D18C303